MRILVTGCAGFIGSHTCEYLLKRGDQVLGIDNLNDYYDVERKMQNLEMLKKYENFTFRNLLVGTSQRMALENFIEDNLHPKFVYFSDIPMVGKVFSFLEYCEDINDNKKIQKECGIYMTINWLIVSTLSTLVISILTLFPFFIIKPKKEKK